MFTQANISHFSNFNDVNVIAHCLIASKHSESYFNQSVRCLESSRATVTFTGYESVFFSETKPDYHECVSHFSICQLKVFKSHLKNHNQDFLKF